MQKLRIFVLASAAALVGLSAQPAKAQPREPLGGMGMGRGGVGRGGMRRRMRRRHRRKPPLAVMAKAIGLNAKQVAQIRTISFETAKKTIGIRAKLQLARLELKHAMGADKAPSEATITGMVSTIGRLETEMKKLHLLRLLRVRKTMSLGKWRKLEAFHARHRRRRRGHRPRRGRPPLR